MGCYTVPLTAAIVLLAARKSGRLNGGAIRLLNLMMGGGAVMLVVDHAWNNELFAFSVSDLLLGFVMTAALTMVWGLVVLAGKTETVSSVQAKV